MRLNLHRLCGWAALAVCLQLAQLALIEHGVEHAFHDRDEACVECLALSGFAAVPAQLPRLPAHVAMPRVAQVAVPPAPTFSLYLAFNSRAPPELLR